MTTMLVIDTASRSLDMFTANVTKAEAGLIVRPGLELPGLGFFAKGADWRLPKDSGGLPVLLIGDGYSAQSSAGFVSLHRATWHGGTTLVVGWMGDRGLRAIRPKVARILWPVRVVQDKSFANSNQGTADAAVSGLPLLAAADRSAIVIAEGQSDRVQVYRLLPADPNKSIQDWAGEVEIHPEHRAERFTRLACAQAAARAGWHVIRRLRTSEGQRDGWLEDARGYAAQLMSLCAQQVGWKPADMLEEQMALSAALEGLPGPDPEPVLEPEEGSRPDWERELLEQ